MSSHRVRTFATSIRSHRAAGNDQKPGDERDTRQRTDEESCPVLLVLGIGIHLTLEHDFEDLTLPL